MTAVRCPVSGVVMQPARQTPALRIYRDEPDDRGLDAHTIACRELLRPASGVPTRRDLEPFSRGWFEELEFKRYEGAGAWLRRMLEFSRHPGESLLMFGAGAGSDAVQYHRHGTQVTVCGTPDDPADLIRRNFELRGHTVRLVQTGLDCVTPFSPWSFDLAYVNALFVTRHDIPPMVAEVYRVLKPGGKVFVLAPAKYDADFWQHWLLPFRGWYRSSARFTEQPGYSSWQLKRLFPKFEEHRVAKRHVRRGELPYLWRMLPKSLLDRGMGRVLILRAFKPVTVALDAAAA